MQHSNWDMSPGMVFRDSIAHAHVAGKRSSARLDPPGRGLSYLDLSGSNPRKARPDGAMLRGAILNDCDLQSAILPARS